MKVAPSGYVGMHGIWDRSLKLLTPLFNLWSTRWTVIVCGLKLVILVLGRA